jgi:predicted nuclease of predicted toxin-antitoxin system
VKSLIDHQLPPALKLFFQGKGIEAVHVADVGMHSESDRAVWAYAKTNSFDLVSKDEDFIYLSSQDQAGPRVSGFASETAQTPRLFRPSSGSGRNSNSGWHPRIDLWRFGRPIFEELRLFEERISGFQCREFRAYIFGKVPLYCF